jgi:two-component system sensor histidine kinase/response regulator
VSGEQLLEEIRRDWRFAALPVVLLAAIDKLDQVTAPGLPAHQGYAIKPVRCGPFFHAVRSALGLERPDRAAPAAARQQPTQPGLRILLAEDNAINQRLAVALLQRAGHQIVAVENGKQALDLLARGGFDLVLMDVQMPEVDGLTATRIIRADPKWDAMPIVALTAHALKGDRERCLAAGMDDYVSKPIRPEELFAAIDRQIPGRRSSLNRQQQQPSNTPVDLEVAIDRLGGDEAFFLDLIRTLEREADSELGEIERAAAEGDAGSVQRLAHSLKGAAASMAAEPVRAAAYALELIGAEKRLHDAPQALATLRRAVKELHAFVARLG